MDCATKLRRKSGWLIAAAILLGGAGAAADPVAGSAASGAPLYRWVDEQGRIHYSDRVPAEAAQREHAQIDARGRTRKIVPAEKSAEEIAAEQRQSQAAEQQASYDRYLLQAYASVAEMRSAREEQLAILDGRIAAAQKSLAANDATLADLHSRADAVQSEGADAVHKLDQQLQTFQSARQESADALSKAGIERMTTAHRFDTDIARYQKLRGQTAEVSGSATP